MPGDGRFKCQHATWIRCTLYVSVLHTSYTDINKDGTHYVVVGTPIQTHLHNSQGRQCRCAGGADQLAVVIVV